LGGIGRHAQGLQGSRALFSRLGQDQVQRLVLVADHRQEAAYRIDPLDQPAQPRRACDAEAFLSTGGMPRPLWLLNEPLALPERQHRPWWHGPLTLLAGPERIETGWWDARLIQRDYFIAQAESSSWLWIYRTRPAHEHDSGWFLQGLFG
jgi:protein ImuB